MPNDVVATAAEPSPDEGIALRNWKKWQGSIITNVMKSRRARIRDGKAPPDAEHAPLSIQSVAIAAVFDEDFAAFAALVGPAVAETYFVRTCQYIASGHALDGACPVRRDRFAAVVLVRPWHIVPKKVGEQVYDALLSSRLAVPLRNGTGTVTGTDTRTVSGNGTGTALARAPTRVPSLSEPCLAVPSPPPNPPRSAGGEPASPSDNGHGEGPHLRPREQRKIAEQQRLKDARQAEVERHRRERDAAAARAATPEAQASHVRDLLAQLGQRPGTAPDEPAAAPADTAGPDPDKVRRTQLAAKLSGLALGGSSVAQGLIREATRDEEWERRATQVIDDEECPV